jgi:hypothetical protein
MITEFSFGRIVINGMAHTNDIKVVKGHIVPDWWRKSGHCVEIEDVQDILDADPEILVIGKGQPGYMNLSENLRKLLEKKEIQLIEEPTSKAIQTFNRLLDVGKNVSAGFHVGC